MENFSYFPIFSGKLPLNKHYEKRRTRDNIFTPGDGLDQENNHQPHYLGQLLQKAVTMDVEGIKLQSNTCSFKLPRTAQWDTLTLSLGHHLLLSLNNTTTKGSQNSQSQMIFLFFPKGSCQKKTVFFWDIFPKSVYPLNHPRVFVRFGKTKGEIWVGKGDFRGNLGGF